jgi:protein MpaA
MPNRVNVDQLLIDLQQAATKSGFHAIEYGWIASYPLFGFTRKSPEPSPSTRRIYLSAGIHGDEPAGPFALLELLRHDALPKEHDYFICPVMNPTGLASGTRENAEGIDLNRDYTDFRSAEIAAHRDWARENITQLDLALHLHEDWEASGFYLYELNLDHHPSRAPAILTAVQAHIPIEAAHKIDGHPARGGIIRPNSLAEVPEGLPEAIYFQKAYRGINHTLETPSARMLTKRVAAQKAAILAAIGISHSTETSKST